MSSFAKQLQSGTIRLRVEGDKEFVVHRALLRSLADVHFSAHERYVDFDGDEDTVSYLLEYLYRGDYTAEPKPRAAPHSPTAERVPNGDEHRRHQHDADDEARLNHPMVVGARTSSVGVWGRPGAVHTRYLQESQATSVDEGGLSSVTYVDTSEISAALAAAGATDSTSPPDQRQSADDASSLAFLVHGRVYLLAERFGVAGLQQLALQKLRAVMKANDVEERSDQTFRLVPLIKMAYQLQPVGGTGNGHTVQQLRDIVVEQAVDHLAELQKGDHLKAFVRDGGAFVDDLFSRLARKGLSLR